MGSCLRSVLRNTPHPGTAPALSVCYFCCCETPGTVICLAPERTLCCPTDLKMRTEEQRAGQVVSERMGEPGDGPFCVLTRTLRSKGETPLR